MDGEALIVKAGGARFALPMARITEVRAYTPETRVPGTPRAVRGIVERDGKPVYVLDVVGRLSSGMTEPRGGACFVFFDRGAILVEEVERIVERAADDTASPLDIDALFEAEQP
jgi:chemotaxis signal transduction protein